MLASHRALHRRLDDLAIDALVPPPAPVATAWDSEVSIEIVREDDCVDELAKTGHFVRFSAPYERIEIDHVPSLAAVGARTFTKPRPVRFARTISAAERSAHVNATVPFERVWFDDEPEAEEPAVEVKASWWWLVVSLAAGGAAIAAMAFVSY